MNHEALARKLASKIAVCLGREFLRGNMSAVKLRKHKRLYERTRISIIRSNPNRLTRGL